MKHPLSRIASSPSLAPLRDAGVGHTQWPGKAGSTGALALALALTLAWAAPVSWAAQWMIGRE
ncbi:hypothetical protein [Acidovorax radicis]|uniref:hypothetical protein n=1 Tax=Acidovorax radicis TaxID=758826 RepID=UPI001CF99C1D|nr:hypothetical protein [Acidovorax radicis]UCV00654.1 hypothetical protein KI609_07850 [Acidovorax radicis]